MQVNEAAADYLQGYSGEYLSNLDLDDQSGMPLWKKDNHALWMKDNIWRIGSLANQGTSTSDFHASDGGTLCPNMATKWRYKDPQGSWIDAGPSGVILVPGKQKLHKYLVTNPLKSA